MAAVESAGAATVAVRPGSAAGLAATFASLRYRDFRLLWLGQAGHSAIVWMEQVARGWLTWELTQSALDLGLVTAVRAVPFLVAPLLVGLIVDRVDRRRILLATQGVEVALKLAMALLIVSGNIAVWHLYLTSILLGASMSFNIPARLALTPSLVGKGEVTNAIALNSAAMNVNKVLGPAAAGVLIGLISTGGVYLVMVGIGCLMLLGTYLMRVPQEERQREAPALLRDLGDGLRYLRGERDLLLVIGLALAPIVLAWPYQTLLPIFADEIFHVGAPGLGLMHAVTGIGALLGSLFIAWRSDLRRPGLVLLGLNLLFGVFIILFAFSPNFLLALLALAVVGSVTTAFMSVTNGALLQLTAPQYRGRVMAIFMLDRGLSPLGQVAAAGIAALAGAPMALAIFGALAILVSAGFFLASPRVRTL